METLGPQRKVVAWLSAFAVAVAFIFGEGAISEGLRSAKSTATTAVDVPTGDSFRQAVANGGYVLWRTLSKDSLSGGRLSGRTLYGTGQVRRGGAPAFGGEKRRNAAFSERPRPMVEGGPAGSRSGQSDAAALKEQARFDRRKFSGDPFGSVASSRTWVEEYPRPSGSEQTGTRKGAGNNSGSAGNRSTGSRRGGARIVSTRPEERPAVRPEGTEKLAGWVQAKGKWFAPAGERVRISKAALWVARTIYAESNRPHEQELIAWVIRNRRENNYHGNTTYRGVVLEPSQFSPFNEDAPYSNYYRWLPVNADPPKWKEAMRIAAYVLNAPAERRPFSSETHHFFSQVSMRGQGWPSWAEGVQPVEIKRTKTVDPFRFRFFDLPSGVSP